METRPPFRNGKRTHSIPGSSGRSPRSIIPFLILVVLLAVIAIIALYFLTSRTITLIVDTVPYPVRTYQSTVRGLLAEQGLSLHEQDIISPEPDTVLQSGMSITVDKANLVVVEADGKQDFLHTRETDPQQILAATGIILNSGDMLLVDNQPYSDQPYSNTPRHLVVIRERQIHINDDGVTSTFYVTPRTVGEILHNVGLQLHLADQIEPDPSAFIDENGLITVKRSVPIRVQVDGRSLTTRTHGKTVDTALAEVGIALIGLDYVTPEGSTPVTTNMEINVVRVTEEDVVQQIPIPFGRSTQVDPTLPVDARQIIQQGKEGLQEVRVRIRREDGVEVSRSEPQNFVVQQPRDEITAVGTLPVLKILDTPDGTIEYWRVIKMRAASYKPSSTGKTPDDPTYGITASGEKLRKGIVAVDPTVIPLGTMLYIPGYGKALASDTGGLVKGLVIDLGYSDEDYEAWSGEVEVYVLAPAPAPQDVPLLQEIP